MLFERDYLAELFHLQQFAFDHLLRELNERVKNPEVAFLYRDLERLHVKPVAGEHALRVSPLRVCSRAPAPDPGFVNYVVVDECCGVDNLNYRPEFDRAATLVVEKFRR